MKSKAVKLIVLSVFMVLSFFCYSFAIDMVGKTNVKIITSKGMEKINGAQCTLEVSYHKDKNSNFFHKDTYTGVSLNGACTFSEIWNVPTRPGYYMMRAQVTYKGQSKLTPKVAGKIGKTGKISETFKVKF
ncbi:MAG: hypothetical protein ABIJ59_00605 [Pseudomonadota bacterium]